jgi:hypothetical protein
MTTDQYHEPPDGRSVGSANAAHRGWGASGRYIGASAPLFISKGVWGGESRARTLGASGGRPSFNASVSTGFLSANK